MHVKELQLLLHVADSHSGLNPMVWRPRVSRAWSMSDIERIRDAHASVEESGSVHKGVDLDLHTL